MVLSPTPASDPELAICLYDRISSFLISAVSLLTLTTIVLLGVWLTNRLAPTVSNVVSVEFTSGGSPDGAVNETLQVESPADPADDPSVAEEPSETTELMLMLQDVLEVSDQATRFVAFDVPASDSANSGEAGSAEGTGRRALGERGAGGGTPREQRWFIRFDTQQSLKSYAEQLAWFSIEPAAWFADSKRLVYLADITTSPPRTREAATTHDKRLFMSWTNGDRRLADLALFEKAGIDARNALVGHFYPPATEALLVRAERAYQNQPSNRIRRTYFVVARTQSGYEFRVVKQILR